MKFVSTFGTFVRRHRMLRPVIAAALTLMVSVMLITTIYLTLLDLQWLTFLGGVLFAAVLALASQVSKAEWLVIRRSKQLERYKERLAKAAEQTRTAIETARLTESRVRVLLDALPDLVFYVDRDLRCRLHNHTVCRWTGWSDAMIEGQALQELLESPAYAIAAPRFLQTLAGKPVEYRISLANRTGGYSPFDVRQFPYPSEGTPDGFFLVLTKGASAAPGKPAHEPESRHADTRADAAVAARENGKALYVNAIAEQFVAGNDDRDRLVRALHDNEFMLFSQKITALKKDLPEPDCHEVLLRLKEEEENMLPPGGFIPMAERYGLMDEIDRWVLRTLVNWCLTRQARDPGWRPPMFGVNLSDVSIANPSFAAFVRAELQRPGFPSRALCFEIGESDLLERNEDVRHFVAALKPTGCRFAIDGFGSLKVSFAQLEDIPVDFLKLNGMIIQNMLNAPAELAKVKAINSVCEKMGIRTVAMFVESEEAVNTLRAVGIDYVQGFGIARPQPIDAVAQ